MNSHIFGASFSNRALHGYPSILADVLIVLPPLSSVREEQKHHASLWYLAPLMLPVIPSFEARQEHVFLLTITAVVFADR